MTINQIKEEHKRILFKYGKEIVIQVDGEDTNYRLFEKLTIKLNKDEDHPEYNIKRNVKGHVHIWDRTFVNQYSLIER